MCSSLPSAPGSNPSKGQRYKVVGWGGAVRWRSDWKGMEGDVGGWRGMRHAFMKDN